MELNKKEMQDNLYEVLEMAQSNNMFDLLRFIVAELKPTPMSITRDLAAEFGGYAYSPVSDGDGEESKTKKEVSKLVMDWGGTLYLANYVAYESRQSRHDKVKELIKRDPQVLNTRVSDYRIRKEDKDHGRYLTSVLASNAQIFYSIYHNYRDIIKADALSAGLGNLSSPAVLSKILKKISDKTILNQRENATGISLGVKLLIKVDEVPKDLDMSGFETTLKDVAAVTNDYIYYLGDMFDKCQRIAPYIKDFGNEESFSKSYKIAGSRNGSSEKIFSKLGFLCALVQRPNCPEFISKFAISELPKFEKAIKDEDYMGDRDREIVKKMISTIIEKQLKGIMGGGK